MVIIYNIYIKLKKLHISYKKDINMTSIEYSEESLRSFSSKRDDLALLFENAFIIPERNKADTLYKNAILSDDIKAVRCLIDDGVEIYTSSVKYAIYKSNFEIVELLKKNEHQHAYSKDINVFPGLFNQELISIPLFHENPKMVLYLIKIGCVMNLQSLEGAIRSKNLNLVASIIHLIDTELFDGIFEIIVEFGTVEILNYFRTNKISIPTIFKFSIITGTDILSSDQFEEVQSDIRNYNSRYPFKNKARCEMSEWYFNTPLWYQK